MKTLVTYINESFLNLDTSLVDVPEKMRDVAKLKILMNKFDKFGEEEEYEEGKDPYDKLLNLLNSVVKEKKFNELEKERRNSYSEDYNQKVKNRMKYCDKLFSAVYADYKKEQKRGWEDPSTLTCALVGIAYWIENYAGFKEEESNKYLGKLCAKYEKIFNINPDNATQITKIYDKQKVSIQQAVDLENKTKTSVQAIKDDFKNHKYTVFCDSHESAAQIYLIDNSDYDTLDEAFEKTAGAENAGTVFNGYTLDKKLRQLVNDGKINALFLCSGYYCIGQDKDKTIPTFGYYDEDITDKELYKYSTYDSKYYYCGKIGKDKKPRRTNQGPAYYWYDSLWTTHNKN